MYKTVIELGGYWCIEMSNDLPVAILQTKSPQTMSFYFIQYLRQNICSADHEKTTCRINTVVEALNVDTPAPEDIATAAGMSNINL